MSLYLEGDEKGDGLDAVVASVNIVAHEEIVGVGRLAPDLEELHEVVELSVHVPAHGDGAHHPLHVALLGQDLLRLLAEDLHLVLGQLLALHQLLDPSVQVLEVLLLVISVCIHDGSSRDEQSVL